MLSGVSVTNSSSLIVLIIYFVVLISIGLIAGRKVKNDADYAVGGRNVPGYIGQYRTEKKSQIPPSVI